MTETKYSFQLTNTEGQNALDLTLGDSTEKNWNYTDLDLENGSIRLVSGQEAMVQSVLKAIFTERTNGSYGSNIYNLVGFKSDIVVRRMSLFLDLSMCILNLKISLDEQAQTQNLSGEDLIATVGKLVVTEDPENPTVSKIQMSLINNDTVNNTLNIGVL